MCHDQEFQAMSLGDRFCMSRKTGGGGWVHPMGETCMAMSGLGCKKLLWLEPGGPFSA